MKRRTAERILDRPAAAGSDPVARLLTAAAGPAAPAELSHERVALEQFRSRPLTQVSPTRRPSMLKITVAKLLAAKLLTTAVAATAATGGVVLAAATGNLPDSLQQAAHTAVNAPAVHHGKPASKPSRGTETEPSGSADARPSSSAAPAPSLTGLCTAYQAGATANHGKALANFAFTALVTAAGGTDQVGSYCLTLIGAPASHPAAPSTHPTGAPSSHPAAAPTHPTGAPSTHPTGAPSTHPTGAPSTHPTGH